MIVDTSAIIAVLFDEPERGVMQSALLDGDDEHFISAATLLEAHMVARGRFGEAGVAHLDRLVRELRIAVIPVDEQQARVASAAHARFGRGGQSPAKLNFGDCFAYALAMVRDEPLLFKGDDFGHTDVRNALGR